MAAQGLCGYSQWFPREGRQTTVEWSQTFIFIVFVVIFGKNMEEKIIVDQGWR